MRIKKENEWKTTFRIKYELFEYRVMSFELANASTTFQAYINKALTKRLNVNVIVFLNDILIYFENSIKHDDDVIWMLKQLIKHDLYINRDKCRFKIKKMQFLNYVIFLKEVTMQQNKLKAIRQWSKSHNVIDIQIFLDLINFYRRFIRNFNRIASSLIEMFKEVSRAFRKDKSKKRKHRSSSSKSTIAFLTSTTKKTFDTLKIVFMKKLLLHHFDFKCKLRVEIDASIKTIDDVLCQLKNDEWHSIVYFSQKMNSTQCNYETHDQKLLIIVETFKHWRYYFEKAQHEMLMLTNHHNLKKFMTTTKLSSRQVRWAQELSRYNFNIDYR